MKSILRPLSRAVSDRPGNLYASRGLCCRSEVRRRAFCAHGLLGFLIHIVDHSLVAYESPGTYIHTYRSTVEHTSAIHFDCEIIPAICHSSISLTGLHLPPHSLVLFLSSALSYGGVKTNDYPESTDQRDVFSSVSASVSRSTLPNVFVNGLSNMEKYTKSRSDGILGLSSAVRRQSKKSLTNRYISPRRWSKHSNQRSLSHVLLKCQRPWASSL